ncbi:MAG: hypothetical protein V7788_08555 [Alphaproteobacteria bacterium]
MLSDDRKRELLALWRLDGSEPIPQTDRDWEFVEFGLWAASGTPMRVNDPHFDRLRVALLVARRMRDEGLSASVCVDLLSGVIARLDDPENLIGEDTLLAWTTRKERGYPTPSQRVKADKRSVFWASSIDADIAEWEELTGQSIADSLPEGW